MAGLSPLKICHTMEFELQNCQVANAESGRNTYKILEALNNHGRTSLTQVISAHPVKPNDPTCTTVNMFVKYKKPNCSPASKSCEKVTLDCSPITTTAIEYENCQITMNKCVAGGFEISADQFDCDCNTTVGTEFRELLKREAIAMIEDYQRQLFTAIASGAGKTHDGKDCLSVPLFCNDEKGKLSLQPEGMYALKNEFKEQSPKCSDEPIIITGSKKLDAYNYLSQQGLYAGTTTTAANAGPLSGNYYYDPEAAEIMNTLFSKPDGGIAFLPDSLSVLEWYCFENANNQLMPGGRLAWEPTFVGSNVVRQKMDIGTPTIGIPFIVDALGYYEECSGKSGKVIWKFQKLFDVFKTPQEAICPGATHNYCVPIEISCESFSCNAICTPVAGTTEEEAPKE